MPVDIFFESLEVEQGDKSIGIIVSGMGTDGTIGLKSIKEASGVVMVQDPETAKFNGMPRSAVDTGLADYVGPIDDLSKKLIAYTKHALQLSGKLNISKQDDSEQEDSEKVPNDTLRKIIRLLKAVRNMISLYTK